MPADNKTADKAEVKDAAGAADTAVATAEDAPTDSDVLAAGAAAAVAKHATMRYATLRIGIFIASLGVLWGLVAATGHIVTGNGVLYLMMGALLVSGVASFFLLSRQRDAMSVQVTQRTERLADRFQENASMEDED
ncbi:hypothetical protein Caci_8063 [Catenulispora acidiphila DSM 44928]|uniref:Uncharacterized protein n=1 Tax=Catenulispora acidiphila (strain DSM 44928 / JCM 14897 / NBRC 102108 / NRRL B-24433 / ID139908) TaxID=479433 RepID=C7QH36_CATAD|nr:DUF4229 domain-containing protein [Catenulispora acidiphila]ACU76886.1 hypothetical protein Caci_8063 [Catenulispora acidiphila DSM 44928]